MYLAVKALHIIFMVTWFAGLFYLPRLFVYHAAAEDSVGIERFKIMERKLFYGIMTPGGLLTLLFGAWLMILRGYEWSAITTWLHWKLGLVGLIIAYHVYLWRLLGAFRTDQNRHSHVYYRWINELPVLALVAIILLAVIKPSV